MTGLARVLVIPHAHHLAAELFCDGCFTAWFLGIVGAERRSRQQQNAELSERG